MDGTDDELPVPLRPAGRGFHRREVVLTAGSVLPYVDEEWADAFVVVARGRIELHCHHGGHRDFEAGAMLWLEGLGLRYIHNPGPGDVLLVAISRRHRPR